MHLVILLRKLFWDEHSRHNGINGERNPSLESVVSKWTTIAIFDKNQTFSEPQWVSVGLIIKLKCNFVFPLSDIEFMFAISVNLHQSGLVVCQPTMLLQIEIFQQLFDLHQLVQLSMVPRGEILMCLDIPWLSIRLKFKCVRHFGSTT